MNQHDTDFDLLTPPENATPGPIGPTWLTNDGVIITVNELGGTHTYEQAVTHLKINRKIAGEKARPLFVDMYKMQSMEREAREEYVKPENAEFVSAVALVTKSTMGRMIANLFINFQKQIVPIKLFNDPAKAYEWLLTFIPENSPHHNK